MPTSTNGWTAGVVHLGPKPTPPQGTHQITLTRTTTHTQPGAARDAHAQRVRRLREVGTPHTVDGTRITYRDETGATVTLNYEEA